MAKKKPSIDINTTAFEILKAITGEPTTGPSKKNPAAVALGRLGGLKGGKARAKSLTPKQRKAIAKNAADKRWGKKS
jgi:hypothetical protein